MYSYYIMFYYALYYFILSKRIIIIIILLLYSLCKLILIPRHKCIEQSTNEWTIIGYKTEREIQQLFPEVNILLTFPFYFLCDNNTFIYWYTL